MKIIYFSLAILSLSTIPKPSFAESCKEHLNGKRMQKMITDIADGVYDETNTKAMIDIAKSNPNLRTEDRNLFEWYENILSLNNIKDGHIIDWGSGVGRMVPLYLAHEAKQITLIEPSVESVEVLEIKYTSNKNVEIQKNEIGAKVKRLLQPERTFHTCNFVINCLESLDLAFNRLEKSILSGEKLFVVTNVFAPKEIVNQIKDSKASSARSIDVFSFLTYNGKLPRSKVFNNKIISTGQILHDSVHTVIDYAKLFVSHHSDWTVQKASLMLPDGFVHQIAHGEDFGDFKFAVFAIELIRK
jgi:hypothetical protein